MNTIAIIPARGGSKGIPRKNLRPVNGKPMIYYSIKACLAAEDIDEVYVSTDDEEIALFAERFGASVIIRPDSLSDDLTTLDPVILHAVEVAEETLGRPYDTVVTVQPTSPLIKASDISRVVNKMKGSVDTVLSVIDDRHLCWTIEEGKFVPAYKARVNRQSLPPNFRETGAVVSCTRSQLDTGSRIGQNVELCIMPPERSFDIDSVAELQLCESILAKKRIVFTVVGYPKVGLGHAFRAVMLANELVKYELIFVCDEDSQLAADFIEKNNYHVERCSNNGLIEKISSLAPDMVINDILDTSDVYMRGLKKIDCKIVNFEDLSPSNQFADLTINALYPEKFPSESVLSGHSYFCLRDEFLHLRQKNFSEEIKDVLVTFGGVDEGNLTKRVLMLLAPICRKTGIRLTVVLGPGYGSIESLELLSKQYSDVIDIVQSTQRISDYMIRADLAITSGGRTVLELACVGVPTVVICQNKRETTHSFASIDNGIVNLGERTIVTDQDIVGTFNEVVNNPKHRKQMIARMKKMDLSSGKRRVISKILELLS